MSDPRFVLNTWYVAAWSRDLTDAPLARTVCEQPIVLFRLEDGTPAALEDLCPHRFLPLSMGRRRGDTIQCGYHGLSFDAKGQCVRVLGQTRIPERARVRAYPIIEHLGLVWVWPGDPRQATREKLFDLPAYHDPNWHVGEGDALVIDAHYLSLADNLCDPAHVSFVHQSTLGSPAGEDIPIHSERQGNTILTYRWTLDSDPVGFFQVFGDFRGRVDRWQYYYLHAPSIAVIDFGSADANTGAPEGDRSNGIRVYSCHFLTPISATCSVDHWLHVRNFALGDDTISTAISDQFRLAFNEDKHILEAVQRRELEFPDREPVRIAIDAGAARLRQVIDEMLTEEDTLTQRT